MSHLTSDPQRWFAAAVLIAGYLVLCGWTVSRRMNSRQHLATASTRQGLTPANDVARIVLAFASQTGLAEQIARQTALALQHAGQPCSVFALNALRPAALAPGSRILLVLSTYGEGDAPDNGALFLGALPSLPSSLGTAPLQRFITAYSPWATGATGISAVSAVRSMRCSQHRAPSGFFREWR